ncbi:MAG TPA: GlsB/YeaQ/YmgE family stress response membrane protein, partial [Acidimicrobiales bacterium]|nr:GlsB/YeaQ/YmgE family stress response membrane protein [Acidimicrobiales bacterium]
RRSRAGTNRETYETRGTALRRGNEDMVGFIITMLVIGAIAGYVARLLVPGPDPMGVVRTILLGIVGSFIGGFLGYVLFDKDIGEGALQASGVIGSIIGAVVALLIYNAVTRPRTSRWRRLGGRV